MARQSDGWTWIVVAAWCGIAALLVAASDAMYELIWVLAVIPLAIWALAGLVLVVVLVAKARWRPAVAVLLTATVIVLSPLSVWGAHAWFFLRFKREEAAYASIVANASMLPPQGQYAGVAYRVEAGPPIRIAFPQPVGVADNWGAVIHDPTDAVATAVGWGDGPGDYTVRRDLQELWGGDLLSCSRITGHYFRCWFT